MKASLAARLAERSQQRQAQGLVRQRTVASPVDNPEGRPLVSVNGRVLLNFSSNDYLGLSRAPALSAAMARAASELPCGSTASPLVCGHHPAHHRLEEALAGFTGYPAVALFASGYQANLAVGQALFERGQAVLADRLNHASLNDGLRLAGARILRYRHADAADAARRLKTGTAALVTDSVFSMDGDQAPLTELHALCQSHDLPLWVDDAHAFGVLGQQGRGALEAQGVDKADIYVATFGKALGLAGAFVAGDTALIEEIQNSGRGLVYSTGMSPVMAETARMALSLVADGEALRQRLRANIQRWQALGHEHALDLPERDGPIQIVPVGDNDRAVALSQVLFAGGFLVSAIRPPTVPAGTARLRITLSASHREQDLDALAQTLANALEHR